MQDVTRTKVKVIVEAVLLAFRRSHSDLLAFRYFRVIKRAVNRNSMHGTQTDY